MRCRKSIHISSVPLLLGVGIIAGDLFGLFFSWGWANEWALIVSVIAIVISFVPRMFTRLFFALLAGFLLGAFCATRVVRDREVIIKEIGRMSIIRATVSEMPEWKNSQTRLKLTNIYLNNSTKQLDSQAYAILTGGNKSIQRSDQITLRGKLQEGFGEYATSIYRPIVLAIDKPDPPDYSAKVRTLFTSRLRKIFNNSISSDLALGFLIGEKTLPQTLKEQLRIVGLSHIVVASGFSLSILANFMKKWMGKISRFTGHISALLLIVVFVSITGLSPSLLRAGLVSGIALFANYFGRKFHPGRLLIYIAAISVLYNHQIILNAAWQLSFSAYAGLILLVPMLKKYFYGNNKPGLVAEMVIISFSAQLPCLPISMYYYGQFSVIGLIANILVTPVISCVMLLTFLCGVFPYPAASLLAFADNLLLNYQITTIQWLSDIKWVTINLQPYRMAVFTLYLPMIIGAYYLKCRTRHSFKPAYNLDKTPDYGKIYSC